MKIRPEVEVFPDADYCNENDQLKCDYLNTEQSSCKLYIFEERGIKDEFGLESHFDGDQDPCLKCDQCKADYLKAKKEEPIDNIVIDGYRYDCIETKVYGVCGGRMAATLICNDKERLEFVAKFKHPDDFSVSTHDGLFNHTGMVMCVGMHHSESGKMCIEIMIMITG